MKANILQKTIFPNLRMICSNNTATFENLYVICNFLEVEVLRNHSHHIYRIGENIQIQACQLLKKTTLDKSLLESLIIDIKEFLKESHKQHLDPLHDLLEALSAIINKKIFIASDSHRFQSINLLDLSNTVTNGVLLENFHYSISSVLDEIKEGFIREDEMICEIFGECEQLYDGITLKKISYI